MKRTEGARLLALTGKTSEEIGSRRGISRALVSHWLRGARLPTKKHQLWLKAEFGIPLKAWKEPALKEPKEPEPKAPTSEMINMSTLDMANHLRRSVARDLVLADDPKTPPGERQRIIRHASQSLATIGKITGETLTISEAKILRSPAWQRIEALLVRLLEKDPERMRAISEALHQLAKET